MFVSFVYSFFFFPVLICFAQPLEIFVDDETKLTLHGLQQHYVKLEEKEKNRKLNELLDTLEFNQVGGIVVIQSLLLSITSGRHLRQVGRSCDRVGQAPGVLQLPEYQYPFGSATGRTVRHLMRMLCFAYLFFP